MILKISKAGKAGAPKGAPIVRCKPADGTDYRKFDSMRTIQSLTTSHQTLKNSEECRGKSEEGTRWNRMMIPNRRRGGLGIRPRRGPDGPSLVTGHWSKETICQGQIVWNE